MNKSKITQFDAHKKKVFPDLPVANILEMIKDGKLESGEKLLSDLWMKREIQIRQANWTNPSINLLPQPRTIHY